MPSQVLTNVENNFTKGLITEFTGLNFPENAATDTDNCVYSLLGDVTRRLGFNYEDNHSEFSIARAGLCIKDYKWNNVGGDGSTQVVVVCIGTTLYFYKSSQATAAIPLSSYKLASTVNLPTYVPAGGTYDSTIEPEFSDGNGYLFIYHPSLDPIYCSFASNVITANRITVKIRDFSGITEPGVATNVRPAALTAEHNYNLINQGWVAGNPWVALSSTSLVLAVGSMSFTVAAGITGVTIGDLVTIAMNDVNPPYGDGVNPSGYGPPIGSSLAVGNVTAYAATTMTINVTGGASAWFGSTFQGWQIVPRNTAYITTWNTAVGGYPSNSDVWWYYKNASGVFDPATTLQHVTLSTGNAPRGHFLLEAFNQQRDTVSAVAGLTDVITTIRPRTGTWFQGRVWYAGVDATQAAIGDAGFYTWTENLYFSNIVNSPDDFGNCFQTNDPTSSTLFDLLPTDGGVIKIQGCGSIYKLFPLQNALLVFAANGVWYITGSAGIGFSANDYTIFKLSSVKSISSTSFVDIQGFPMFWNEEGIYKVEPSQQGNEPDSRRNALAVTPLTIGTILSYYADIPLISKKYARGAYDPIEYVVKWIFKSTEETSVTDRYRFDRVLNFNTHNQAFFPYSLDISSPTGPSINGITYVTATGGIGSAEPALKYLVSTPTIVTFAEEMDTTYVDWVASGTSVNFDSYFITGYKLHGQGQRRFQMPYIYIYSRAEDRTSYSIQGLWDYAIAGDSGRWSIAQLVTNWSPKFGMIFRRHRIRGRGAVLQIKVTSSDGQPFDIMGWSAFETQNTGV